MNAAWSPGWSLGLVGERAALMTDQLLDEALIGRIVEALMRSDVTGALQLVPDPGALGASWCSIASLELSGVRVWLWGSAMAVVGVRGRARVVRGGPEPQWVQTFVADGDGVVLGDPRPPKHATQVVTAPIVQAGSVRLGTAARRSTAAAASVANAEAGPASAPKASGGQITMVYLPDEPDESGPPPPSTVEPPGTILPTSGFQDEGASVAASEFHELWGHTVRRPIEEAAVREVRDYPEVVVHGSTGPGQVLGQDRRSAGSQSRDQVTPGDGPGHAVGPPGGPSSVPSGLISGLPADGRGGTPSPSGNPVVHDGRTVSRAALRPGDPPSSGLRLWADSGESLLLDGSVVVGRAPAPTGQAGERLLVLGSAPEEVSRNHLRLTCHGSRYFAADLGSSNGSVLIRAQGVRVELSARVPVELFAGDAVQLGGAVTVHVEPAPPVDGGGVPGGRTWV